ncbi:MAG: TAXI family TRAP transporter solute-binding subunit [Burkholderiaceae bacterium]
MNRKTIGRMGATVLAAASVLGSTVAYAADPARVSVITAPFGTGSYVMASALEEISKQNKDGIQITSSESPGFIFNIKKLDKEPALRKSMIVGSGAGVVGLATLGSAPFTQKYPPLKLIANYSVGAYWLATLDPKIKTVADLAGKKVALGRAAQINWAVQPAAIMRDGYGLGKDKVDLQYVGTKDAIDALLNGTTDAAVVGGYVDPATHKMVLSPQTSEFIASGRKITFLGWSPEAIDKTIKAGMKMAQYTVPANTLQGVAEPLVVHADTTSWMVSPEFPDDLAYSAAKLVIDNLAKFGEFHAQGKLMSRDGLVYGWSVDDLHPGALRAYREAGIVK